MALDLGILLPPLHLRDDLALDATTYRVLLRGTEIARGRAFADRTMVLDPGGGEPNIDGIALPEPAFGLPARWVTDSVRREAEERGLTVVDCASTLTTHL